MAEVLCLRPKADFEAVGVTPPEGLSVEYRGPNDDDIAGLLKNAQALVIPAVGPKIPSEMLRGTALKLV